MASLVFGLKPGEVADAFDPLTPTIDLPMAVGDELIRRGIVPDVDDPFTPNVELGINYPSGSVNYGTKIKPAATAQPPSGVSWTPQPGALYTLILVDPDAPSRREPKYRSWRHWIVTNIPGCDVAHGATVSPYVGAAPMQGTGFHRYVFRLFRQPGSISEAVMSTSELAPASFDVRAFAKKHGLGHAVGANWFVACHEAEEAD
eukprot:TRINITY_DN13435_c0_g1_i2.p1 TRINITY_DN13435_c0_g1~~TRINITY_DN13435_c0_g1_i2.p1  ORF type:complete len:203 (-),score=75.90 TRINITY_DN13435_c0_g1_i2:9-617(-)